MATKFGVPIGIATRWRFEKSSKAIKAFFFASLHFARFLDTLQRAMLYLPLSTETGKADFQGLPNWKAHGPIETKFDTADRCCYIVGLPRTTNSLQSLQGALFPLSIWWICRFSVCFSLFSTRRQISWLIQQMTPSLRVNLGQEIDRPIDQS